MENLLTTPMEGEQEPKFATEAVSDVLEKSTKNNQFLQNVGIKIVPQRRRGVHTVEAELEMEKSENTELRPVVDSQQVKVDDLSIQVQANQNKQVGWWQKSEVLLSQNRAN
jgi:hypothetical protein